MSEIAENSTPEIVTPTVASIEAEIEHLQEEVKILEAAPVKPVESVQEAAIFIPAVETEESFRLRTSRHDN